MINESSTVRLEITRRADLAVRALSLLSGTAQKWKATTLAGELDTTVGFVPQVIGPLVKAGWVRSDPGPTGGYVALVSGRDVSVLDVIEAVDGRTDAGRCVVEDRPCPSPIPCSLHAAWKVARQELMRELAATAVADVSTAAHV